MLQLEKMRVKDFLKFPGSVISKEIKNGFQSEFKGNLLYHLLKNKVYIIIKRKQICGLLIAEKSKKKLNYIPYGEERPTFFQFLRLLKGMDKFYNYNIVLRYRNINIDRSIEYFDIKKGKDILNMKTSLKEEAPIIFEYENISIRHFNPGKDEYIRVMLQNDIFSTVEGRRELTVKEVLSEVQSSSFIPELSFILYFDDFPVGYGQILKKDERYYLVNFGVTSEKRGKGYGSLLLSKIKQECYDTGIKDLYLDVDRNNAAAIKLYKKAGFMETDREISLKLDWQ